MKLYTYPTSNLHFYHLPTFLLRFSIAISISFSSTAQQQLDTTMQQYSLKLGATRLIYSLQSTGVTVTVYNQQDYPILVESQVYAEDKISEAPFIVTPPLFRLEAKQQSKLRVVATEDTFATDRETMQWLCVTGLPPTADALWAKEKDISAKNNNAASLHISFTINNCIKLFVRPSKIKGQLSDVASSIIWTREGKQLKVNNPTPFYINLSSVKLSGNKVNDLNYVPPFSSRLFAAPKIISGILEWQFVNDYGGESLVYKTKLK